MSKIGMKKAVLLSMAAAASGILTSAYAQNTMAVNNQVEKKTEANVRAKHQIGSVSQEEFKKLTEKHDFISKNPGIKFVKGEKRDKFYQIMMEAPNGQRFEAVIVPGSDYVIVGRVFTKSGEPVNLPADMEKVKEGVAFTVGHGAKKVYLVTDPQCPYCQRLETAMKNNPEMEKEFTIEVIPMPLSFHKNARPMLYYILSADKNDERVKRMKEVMGGSDAWRSFNPSPEQKRKIDAEIQKGIAAAKELGARGTPAMFSENGTPIDPYSIANFKQRPATTPSK